MMIALPLFRVCNGCGMNCAGTKALPATCPRCGHDWLIMGEWTFLIYKKDWAFLKAIGVGTD